METKYDQQKVFCVSAEMKFDIEALAEAAETTSSAVIRECLRNYLPRLKARITREKNQRENATENA